VAERSFGGSVYLFAYDPRLGGNRKRSLGFPVRDADGKLIQENVKQAKREAVQLSNRLIAGESPRGRVTLGELFELFRREVVDRQSRRQRTETLRELELWNNFLGYRFVVERFGPREWNAFIAERSSGEIDGRGRRVVDPTQRRPVRDRTVAKSLKALRHACRFGTSYRVSNGGFLLERDLSNGLPIPVEKNPLRPLADYDRYEELLSAAAQVRMRVTDNRRVPSYLRELLTLAEGTGRRIGAIVALKFSDWDPNNGPYGSLHWRADSDKLDKEWWAPVTPEVREAIERIRRERPGVGDAWPRQRVGCFALAQGSGEARRAAASARRRLAHVSPYVGDGSERHELERRGGGRRLEKHGYTSAVLPAL
jgi:integrase